MSANGYEAVVIGAGVNGLVAASYLAKNGKRVLIAEARGKLGGLLEAPVALDGFTAPLAVHALYALDPRVVRELRLSKHGLAFTVRDMPLAGLRADGRHVVLPRDGRACARSIAIHSAADAQIWPLYRRELLALGRTARKFWWEPGAIPAVLDEKFASLKHQSVAAFLDSWFESEALKSTLAFDGLAGGTSPLEPGSALTLVWRAAQEMCGLQDGVAIPKGGPAALIKALVMAASVAGVEIRTGVTVSRLDIRDGAVAAVELASGEVLPCRAVFSSLARDHTLLSLACGIGTGFAEGASLKRARPRAGAAMLVLSLSTPPRPGGVAVPQTARMILSPPPEALAAASAVAREGILPDDLAMEIVFPTAAEAGIAPPGQHLLSALVRPVPLDPVGGWAAIETAFAERVVAVLDRQFTGLARQVTGVQLFTPKQAREIYNAEDEAGGAISNARLLASWGQRIATPVQGLYLCGASAEPVGAVSGRAGRLAAAMLLERRRH